MRVLLLTPAFPPEITGSGNLMYELAERLAADGHTVTVITAMPRQRLGDQKLDARYGHRLLLRETVNGIQVLRVRTLPLPLSFPLTKGLDHFATPLAYLTAGFLTERQDVVLAYSPPLPLGLTALLLARRHGIPSVLNAQDMVPQYAIDVGLMKNPLIIWLFRSIERFVYRYSTILVVHSEGNRQYLISRGVNPLKIVVVSNWVDTECITPGSKDNGFRHEHGLDGRFIISYAGTMGWAQNLDNVIECAELLRSYPEILFVLVGDGPKRKPLHARVEALSLDNVIFLPLQERDRYISLLNASDVCLISLNPCITTPVVPGKLFDIMASGRPVVGDVPIDGDAPKILAEGPCGICVDSNNPDQLAEAILRLYRNPALAEELGQNGRKLAERKYSRSVCTGAFEQALLDVSSRKPAS
jgi:glycosyltransferase involved in cell wall biosynthesis